MEYFVAKDSIVREIWGKSDTILLIFAGASAEFALNRAVDWLYYTGKLPADPLGRLFSTVDYARKIVFAPLKEAHKAISYMRDIHSTVENQRGYQIPDWAYRDVLFMLIYYSITSYEALERKLSDQEKQEVYDVFFRVGLGMGLKGLPLNYSEWCLARKSHLMKNLVKSQYTIDLFKQYKKNLGVVRYLILREAQELVVPKRVKKLIGFKGFSFLKPALPIYRTVKHTKLERSLKKVLFPTEYANQINSLDLKYN